MLNTNFQPTNKTKSSGDCGPLMPNEKLRHGGEQQ